MASNPPSYTSPGSVSRSKTSRDDIRSLADEMLRASLTRGAASPASVSSAASVSSSLPSYRRSAIPAFPPSSRPPDLLSRERNPGAARPPILGSASVTRDSITGDNKSSSVSSSSSTISVSAADAKARVRHLQREVERAKADMPQRETGGLFKAACSTDLLFLIDTTGSMYSYINAAKEQVKSIVEDIKKSFLNESEVRVAVVSYKDHSDHPNIEFLDFTPSADQVFEFLGRLNATGGADAPEDILGGVHQAVNASWKQQTRCIIHIGDAPPHGAGVLHDLGEAWDYYPHPGSEPHGLTYKPLLKQLIQLNVNYALLRINNSTDRMGLAFAQAYAASGADVKLLPSNRYSDQVNSEYSKSRSGLWSGASKKHADLQFEEMELGTTYSQLRHLVVRTVTTSVSRTAGRMSLALATVPKLSAAGGKSKKMATDLTAIREDEGSGGSAREVYLEKGPPQWDTPGWLDETLTVEGFCPDLVMQSANSLNEMMNADENIKLSVAQLTIRARSKPFAEGSVRVASYARTSASTSKFVIKSFKEDGKTFLRLAEGMRIQALCKAFALEFNGLLKIEPPIDFIVTTCLQSKSKVGSEGGCLSLEPYIEGEYVKYNNNSMFVKEDSPDDPDPFNQIAQAFSHFTFERSWGHFLVNDLQGVGHLLTDPAIQTLDHERFKLADTNLYEEGFKFFFVTHECNSICHKLGLKSNREMVISGAFEFREFWPTIEPTVCCSNKLCRRIVRLASTHESDTFPGHHWCNACWAQLQASMVRWICVAPGPSHEFHMSKFFYESQGQLPPRRCPEHLERDKSVSSAAVVGGNLWSRMKAGGLKRSISGRSW
jgi:Alpha-kinase family/von Willebrand factor type A domain